ncbi:MAG: hypothetical protein MZU84_01945 [Sphingobacterium sp.]|nr:hypothetical protein [Sphingobacterium sp.]
MKVVLCGHPGESFSFFKFVFLNKAHVPEADMDRVLTHELAHVRQLHSFDIIFSELLTVIQWFNPFVWPYRSSAARNPRIPGRPRRHRAGLRSRPVSAAHRRAACGRTAARTGEQLPDIPNQKENRHAIQAGDKRIGEVEAAARAALGSGPRPGLRRVQDGRQAGTGRAAGARCRADGGRGRAGGAPVKLSEEEMAKALKDKMAQARADEAAERGGDGQAQGPARARRPTPPSGRRSRPK